MFETSSPVAEASTVLGLCEEVEPMRRSKRVTGPYTLKKCEDMKIFIVIFVSFFSTLVSAQNKPLACVVDGSGGLIWRNGRWEATAFFLKPDRFILVMSGDTLEKQSVADVLDSGSKKMFSPICVKEPFGPLIQCTSGYINGETLFFDMTTKKGGLSKLFGATTEGVNKDTISVTSFSCTAF